MKNTKKIGLAVAAAAALAFVSVPVTFAADQAITLTKSSEKNGCPGKNACGAVNGCGGQSDTKSKVEKTKNKEINKTEKKLPATTDQTSAAKKF